MTPEERVYLEDTRDILINYDGETTVKGLQELIDETRERISNLLYEEELKEEKD